MYTYLYEKYTETSETHTRMKVYLVKRLEF